MPYNVCAEDVNCRALQGWDSGRGEAVAVAVKEASPGVLTVEEAGRRADKVPTLVRVLAPEYVLVSGGRSRFLFVRADHVYVPAGMTVSSWAGPATPGAYVDQDSDHDPLVVDLTW